MYSVQFVTIKGKKIFMEDFANVKPGKDFYDMLKTAHEMIASQPEHSVLACFDATGGTFNVEMLTAIKDFTKSNNPYIKAAAVVGITGLLEVALSTVSKFSGREFFSFKSRDEAVEFLLSR